jgi:ribonuclease HI
MDPAGIIRALENALARRDVDALPGGYADVLDDSFVEVGQSGRAWTRHETLMALAAAAPDPTVELSAFSADELSPTVWLARYESRIDGVLCHRSSIWIRSGDRFRIRYHQGTRVLDRAG